MAQNSIFDLIGGFNMQTACATNSAHKLLSTFARAPAFLALWPEYGTYSNAAPAA